MLCFNPSVTGHRGSGASMRGLGHSGLLLGIMHPLHLLVTKREGKIRDLGKLRAQGL